MKYSILHGKQIPLNNKVNNSFLLYNTIYSNMSHLNDKLISFCNSSQYSGFLFLKANDYFLLEIYQNQINLISQEINFILTNKIKLDILALDFQSINEEEIKMNFISDRFILIENILKRCILLEIKTGSYMNLVLKGKNCQKKNIYYNPAEISGEDLFNDSEILGKKNLNNSNINDKKNSSKINHINNNSTSQNNTKKKMNSSSIDDFFANNEYSSIIKNYNTLKILCVFDEQYNTVDHSDDISIKIKNTLNNLFVKNNNNEIDNLSNNVSNNNISSNISINNSSNIAQNKKIPKIPINNNIIKNINDNLESGNSNIESSSANRGDVKKNLSAFTTNQNTFIEENKFISPNNNSNNNNIILTNREKNINQQKIKYKKSKRSYIFIADKNILYYAIIDENFILNQPIEFTQISLNIGEKEQIHEMKVIKFPKEDKISYNFFILSKYSLMILPTDFCKKTLKHSLGNSGYDRMNRYIIYYKLNYNPDPLDSYHMVISNLNCIENDIFLLNKHNIINIKIKFDNLKNSIIEHISKYREFLVNLGENQVETNHKFYIDGKQAIIDRHKRLVIFDKNSYVVKKIEVQGYINQIEEYDGNFFIYDKSSKSFEIFYINGEFVDKVSNYKDVDFMFFIRFNKLDSVYFAMEYTINKIFFNKKLYWYSEYININISGAIDNVFELWDLKNKIADISKRYITALNNSKEKCEYCGKNLYQKSSSYDFSYTYTSNSNSKSKSNINSNSNSSNSNSNSNSSNSNSNSSNSNSNSSNSSNSNNSNSNSNSSNSSNSKSNSKSNTNKSISKSNNSSNGSDSNPQSKLNLKSSSDENKNNTSNATSNMNANGNKPIFKCENDKCNFSYCCEEHKNKDFKSFHFFHCKISKFFSNYSYIDQQKFFNDLILLINEILKYIFSNIKDKNDYLFFIPFLRILILLLKNFDMKFLSDTVVERSQKTSKGKVSNKLLIFYQEVVFFYYNLILLSLNFEIKCGLIDYVKNELEILSADKEQLFNKNLMNSTIFQKISRYNYFKENKIEYTEDEKKNLFYIDDNFKFKITFLTQNTIFFSNVIHLYANYLHLIDIVCKENYLNFVQLNPLSVKLISHLIILFEERCRDYPDETYTYFLLYIVPYLTLNKKIHIAEKLLKKCLKLLKNSPKKNIFTFFVLHNLGLLQYSGGEFLDGIHNIEESYKLILDNDFSYHLRIKVVERLAFAYLNIGELMKSYILIKEAKYLRKNLLHIYEKNMFSHLVISNNNNNTNYLYKNYCLLSNKLLKDESLNDISDKFIDNKLQNTIFNVFNDIDYCENALKIMHLFACLNYIKDFVEFLYKIKILNNEEYSKNSDIMSKREYQRFLINYVLGKYDINTKNNTNLIDNYNDDFFNAVKFMYFLDKNILASLNEDNQSKKTIINKEEQLNQNNNKDYHMNNNDINASNSFNTSMNSTFYTLYKDFCDSDENIEFDNDIEIKEKLYEKLSKSEQLTLININSKYFNRKIILRDYYGPISQFNINYHPIYTQEFKNIISTTRHQFFVKKLTQTNKDEKMSYYFFSSTGSNNLQGLSRYLQQEEIQNMFKIEKSKILSLLSSIRNNNNYDNIKKDLNNITTNNTTSDFDNDISIKKETWISGVKKQILKNETRSIQEIDIALNNLYENLNQEYKDEIMKNPELILYYIFTDVEVSNSYTTDFHIRKSAIEQDFYKMHGIAKKPNGLIFSDYENKKRKNSSKEEEGKNDIVRENTNYKRLQSEQSINRYKATDDKKLIFSEHSSSSEESSTFKKKNFNLKYNDDENSMDQINEGEENI